MRKPQNFQWKEMTMGTCYYPEHWSRELWQDDLQRMKAAGITEEMLKQHGVTIDDIVNGKITSEDLKKYGISSSVLDGLNQKDSSSVEEAIKNADSTTVPKMVRTMGWKLTPAPRMEPEAFSIIEKIA